MTMEDVNPNWKGLPVEILNEIFHFTVGYRFESKTYSLALVCKAWMIPAQTVLYSNVEIYTLLQLEKFYAAMEQNPHLGEKVKRFICSIYRDEGGKRLDLMTNLLTNCLPNVEVLHESYLTSYVPVLHALQNSQLRHLKEIDIPCRGLEKNMLADYATCVLHLKDRIKHIKIMEIQDKQATNQSGTETSIAQLYSKRLYDKLCEFDMLDNLNIERKTNTEIQDLEYVLESCKSLKTLSFDFDQPKEEASTLQSVNSSIEAIPTFHPALNIKEMNSVINISSDYSILLYIMHKFSQLQELDIEVRKDNSAQLNQNIFTQLLNYLSKINIFYVKDLPVLKKDIANSISDYWRVTSKPGTEYLMTIYSASHFQGSTCLVDITNNNDDEESCLTLKYCASNRNSEHLGFFEKNGVYLKKLYFVFSGTHYSQRQLLPADFFSHTLTHCPNIQILQIDHCMINEDTLPRLDFFNRASIQELYFINCLFYPRVFERFSMLFSGIKKLCISGLVRGDVAIQPTGVSASPAGDADLEIFMPHTGINCITIETYMDTL